jgi:hypothetical protein
MQDTPFSAPLGKFPYLYTQDERFQVRSTVQPLLDDIEVSIRFCDTRLPAMAAERDWLGFPKRTGPKPEADREDNQRRSVIRARKRCRYHLVMAKCDRMFTYTVRLRPGDLPLTRDQMLKVWGYYIRAAKSTDKNFKFVCTMEPQANGQPHIHAGIKGFKDLGYHHRLWCDAVAKVKGMPSGQYDGVDALGNIDGGVNRFLKRKRSMKDRASRMAAYMSKYMTKDADYVPFNGKRYFHTIGIHIPPALAQWMEAQDIQTALWDMLEGLGVVVERGKQVTPGVYVKFDAYCAFIVVPHGCLPPPPF